MRERTYLLSILFLAGALIINAGPAWSQSVEGEKDEVKKDRGKDQVQSEQRGTEKKSGRAEGEAELKTEKSETELQTGGKAQTGMEKGEAEAQGEIRTKERAQADASVSKEEIKQIQLRLKEQGHDPGPVDGILGSKTQQALKSFQQSKGLQATGKLDADTKMQLGLKKDDAGAGKGKASSKEGTGSESQSKKNGNQGSQKGAGTGMEKGTQ